MNDLLAQLIPVLIPVVTPMITAGVKRVAPKIPKLGVVILQPVLGATLAALGDVTALAGAGLGLAGIGVRETVDQAKKANGRRKTRNLGKAHGTPAA